jgi:hypothetical protein
VISSSHSSSSPKSVALVVVSSSDPTKAFDNMGGLDNLIKAGYTARNITVNGRGAFEVASAGGINRKVFIQANGYYYMMNIVIPDGSTIQSDDILNSWVIGNISQ